jgi:hypothetical protein
LYFNLHVSILYLWLYLFTLYIYIESLIVSDVDECLTNPCLYGASCFNTPGSYVCQCIAGRTGVNCERGECNTTINDQRAASSVVFSDLCNLNRTVYLYVFSCMSLFLYTIICLLEHRDAATGFRFFTITV